MQKIENGNSNFMLVNEGKQSLVLTPEACRRYPLPSSLSLSAVSRGIRDSPVVQATEGQKFASQTPAIHTFARDTEHLLWSKNNIRNWDLK